MWRDSGGYAGEKKRASKRVCRLGLRHYKALLLSIRDRFFQLSWQKLPWGGGIKKEEATDRTCANVTPWKKKNSRKTAKIVYLKDGSNIKDWFNLVMFKLRRQLFQVLKSWYGIVQGFDVPFYTKRELNCFSYTQGHETIRKKDKRTQRQQ